MLVHLVIAFYCPLFFLDSSVFFSLDSKGAPAQESRTWPRLVSPAMKKIIIHPSVLVKNWALENILSTVTRINIAEIIGQLSMNL